MTRRAAARVEQVPELVLDGQRTWRLVDGDYFCVADEADHEEADEVLDDVLSGASWSAPLGPFVAVEGALVPRRWAHLVVVAPGNDVPVARHDDLELTEADRNFLDYLVTATFAALARA
jgi:hypothetical protein